MANHSTQRLPSSSATPEIGDFPFPLIDGPEESQYLTWVRNHSNYMVPRGFLDYLRTVAVLARGIIVNFLIFLPYLLIAAIPLGVFHFWMLDHPFYFTGWVLAGAAGSILIYTVFVPAYRIARYKRSLETGSESSVKERDRYERWFGGLLLGILAVAALESLPFVLEFLHDQLIRGNFGWKESLAAVAAAVTFLSGSDKLLSALGGAKKKLAMVLIAIVGLVLPLVVIFYATDFLLYGPFLSDAYIIVPLILPAALFLATQVALLGALYGWAVQRVFRWKEIRAVQTRLSFSYVILLLLSGVVLGVYEREDEAVDQARASVQHLESLASRIEQISPKKLPNPEVAKLVSAVMEQGRAFEKVKQRKPSSGESDSWQYKLVTFFDSAGAEDAGAKAERRQRHREGKEYLLRALPLIDSVRALSTQPEGLAPLRKEIARQAPYELLQVIEGKLRDEGDGPDAESDERVAELLRRELVAEHLEYWVGELEQYRSYSEPSGSSDPTADAAVERVRERIEFYSRLDEFREIPFLVHRDLADRLRKASVRRIARLLSERQLKDLIEPKIEEELNDFARHESLTARGPNLRQEWINLLKKKDKEDVIGVAVSEDEIHRITSEMIPAVLLEHAVESVALSSQGEGYANRLTALAAEPEQAEIAEVARNKLAAHVFDEIGIEGLFYFEYFLDCAESRMEADADQQFACASPDPDLEPIITKLAESKEGVRSLGVARARSMVGLSISAIDQSTLGPIGDDLWILGPIDEVERPTLKHLGPEDLASISASIVVDALFPGPESDASGSEKRNLKALITRLAFGQIGFMEPTHLRSLANVFAPKASFLALLAFAIWFVWRFTVDVNLTSIHALYRDRLASAFLVGRDTKGDVGIEEDVDLEEICRYEAGSTAPYHLINVALNLQGSKDIGIRDRRSDFFIFSKRFIGGDRTGYCRSETMERVFPQMDLATAMAISAAAASPNMGRGTSPLLVAFMTLLNIRLGYWIPNPGLLEENLAGRSFRQIRKQRKATRRAPGFSRQEVFEQELIEISKRWQNVYRGRSEETRRLSATNGKPTTVPTAAHGLVGIGFSGGGIRSAAINLGITQALHKRGVFDHLDYMSTVSGGGYLGSSISTLMRYRDATLDSSETRKALLKARSALRKSEIRGRVTEVGVETGTNEKIVRVQELPAGRGRGMLAGFLEAVRGRKIDDSKSTDPKPHPPDEQREYRFSKFDRVVVKEGRKVKAGQDLIERFDTIADRFRWRVRPVAFLREMRSKLDETHRWVNLSDGGHIENLATIELLRRRCKYIIIGDGEADPNLHFNGLATLMRCAYLDLGIEIDIDLEAIRLTKASEDDGEDTRSDAHWAIGRILYPRDDEDGQPEEGFLLYLKSSFTGDESEIIREYRHRNPSFPHQSTADQFFDEGQFEAYRELGQHIAELALAGRQTAELAGEKSRSATPVEKMSFNELEKWFDGLWQNRKPAQPSSHA